jgi:hypothetical protein
MSDRAPNADLQGPDGSPVGDGDARVEQLLLGGLDHYFAGRYEQAVHVWTRVLFLDRGHARARAYIERARGALGERQRHSDELLHRGRAAFEDGQVASARSLLTAAVEQGAPTEVALAYLERIDRLSSPAPVPVAPADVPESPAMSDPVREGRRRAGSSVAWSAAGVVGVLALLWVAGTIRDLAGWGPAESTGSAVADAASEPLPVVRASDVALARARALFETGHAADAIRLLATISIADPNRAAADRELADIQRALLAASGAASERAMGPVR